MAYKRKRTTSRRKPLMSKRPRKYSKKAAPKRFKARAKRSLTQNARPRIEGHGSGGTMSKFSMVNKRSTPAVFKNLATMVNNSASGYSIGCPQGKQNAIVSQTLFNREYMNALMTQISSVVAGIPSSVPNANIWKMFLDHLKATQTYRNDTNNEVTLTLYDITPRHDVPATVGEAQDPLSAWSNGNIDAGAATFDYQCPGATPFGSPMFTAMYLVKRVTKIIIPAGGTHEHCVYLAPKRIFNQAEASAYINHYKYLTTFTMAVFRSSPVAIANTGESTLSACRLDQLFTVECHFKLLFSNIPYNVIVNDLRTDGATNFINDETALLSSPTLA